MAIRFRNFSPLGIWNWNEEQNFYDRSNIPEIFVNRVLSCKSSLLSYHSQKMYDSQYASSVWKYVLVHGILPSIFLDVCSFFEKKQWVCFLGRFYKYSKLCTQDVTLDSKLCWQLFSNFKSNCRKLKGMNKEMKWN